MDLRRLFSELRRRRVLRVTGMYLVAGWIVIEVAATLVPVLELPELLTRAIVLLVLLGLPITIALAWAFDITPDGVVRTPAEAQAPPPAQPATAVVDSPPAPAARAARRLPASAAAYMGLGMLIALVSFGAYAFLGQAPPRSAAAIESLAVLPFVNTSGDPDNEYFSDGITEELLGALSRVAGLRVPARTSAFQFKGQTVDVRDVGRRLNVGAVLEGSVQRTGDHVRITANLVDARTGFTLWSDTFDRQLVDLFAMQDEIAARIIAALRLQLEPAPRRDGASTPDIGAHDHYLLGRYHFHRRGAEALRQAERHFRAAIAADPSYASAHAGLALTWAVLPIFDPHGTAVHDAIREGQAAARRALALDAANADAHAALGQIAQNYEWDWNAAERHYTRAVDLAPNDATARQWRAEVMVVRGQQEAGAEMEAALALDPLSPITTVITALTHSIVTRDHERALELWRRADTLDPEFALTHELAPITYAALGRWPELRSGLRRLARSAADSAAFDAWVDAARTVAAREPLGADALLRAYDAAARFGRLTSLHDAGTLLLTGPVDPSRALDLYTAMADDPRYRQQVLWVGQLWFFDALRDDPRHRAIRQRLNL